ncbi:LacI family transcriptional regulator [Bifidobacterium lemurum]|uniref:LacI family transcriptional regulator n=1 Tax=Bifidobacterium lemurum TaxID=1603886 RepID=A0A261FUI5_9BIFI|nr:LacI family DNA-binding transcriptional regulator [Bifidobacterium lemurum]OZG62819.1 LacI family transcriptional regulator [Bifidobacterium lemurum]QOL35152.1 LacI family DNA-binding transcriptional regulator [Bifidobacterium lemurum]
MERATISDVAQLAGVSQATVSRALRGVAKVSPETRLRVEQAANNLNFTLSKSASALASGKTMRVLLLVSGTLDRWFNSSVLQGAYDVLSPEGYDIIPSFVTNRAQLDHYFAELPKNRNADAIIVSSFTFTTELHDRMAAMGMPVIGLDSPSTDGFDASIAISNADGLKQSVHLLHSLGHRRLAFIRDYVPQDMVYSTTTRADCFASAIDALDAGLEYTILTAHTHVNTVEPEELAPELASLVLSSPLRPTGLVVETDELAVPLMKELRHQHMRFPEDMSIVGFDDAPISRVVDLTTIHQNPIELGHSAARKALSLMRGETLERSHEVQPTTLVLRDTTGRAPNVA